MSGGCKCHFFRWELTALPQILGGEFRGGQKTEEKERKEMDRRKHPRNKFLVTALLITRYRSERRSDAHGAERSSFYLMIFERTSSSAVRSAR